jgi:hypothetical protein
MRSGCPGSKYTRVDDSIIPTGQRERFLSPHRVRSYSHGYRSISETVYREDINGRWKFVPDDTRVPTREFLQIMRVYLLYNSFTRDHHIPVVISFGREFFLVGFGMVCRL